ncbi:hypothetical protein Ahy_A10g047803 [Arachis hypogaea]|uniref:Transposase MuDR plant domain-containing protein n=1 Tax=Arachis hypogaea TaxID=3818 RepID=A0A445B3L4_ARAHY|nr:hypothetical protein Ahy_A10g047803 [Arachis hypogaea]
MSFVELQNGLCDNIQSHILKRHSGLDAVGEEVNVNEFGDIFWEEDNNDSKEEFEANYEVDDENDDRNLAGNPVVQNEADSIVSRHPFGVPSFMRTLDLEVMHAPEFSEYANMGEGNVTAEDGEFSVRMEFGSRKSVERLPCCHVLACCTNRHLDWQVYVHDVYKMSEICKVYRGEFVSMGDPSTWDRYEGAKVIHNWTLRRTTKGRPKSTRYLNEMDS